MFVVRIRGINGTSPKVRKILELLRLLRINSGVFVQVNKATMNMIRRAEPYLAYGCGLSARPCPLWLMLYFSPATRT